MSYRTRKVASMAGMVTGSLLLVFGFISLIMFTSMPEYIKNDYTDVWNTGIYASIGMALFGVILGALSAAGYYRLHQAKPHLVN